jgi:hypothetical protein
MLNKMSWTDTFARLVISDSMYYKLPTNIRSNDAPSHIIVDGFGIMTLERMCSSVHTGQMMRLIHPDDKNRTPMHASVLTQCGKEQTSIHASIPKLAAGSGNPGVDKDLYSQGQLLAFGAASLLIGLGVGFPVVAPLIGLSYLIAGISWCGIILINSGYHIVDGDRKDSKTVLSVPVSNDLMLKKEGSIKDI